MVVFLGLAGFLGHLTKGKPTAPEETPKSPGLAEQYDPPAGKPMTAQDHLVRARKLLNEAETIKDFNVDDFLLMAALKHAGEAKMNPATKAQATLLSKRISREIAELLKAKAWNSPGTGDSAEALCRQYVADRLKAPSTADWGTARTGRWTNHPGYFLVEQTVDAQNSFGAKLRASYECEVLCLSSSTCEVEKMNQTR